jgi:hypothetical protein
MGKKIIMQQNIYPPLSPLTAREITEQGQGIQRTMRLLATSTPQSRNSVKILFYGQSITEQSWSKQVAEEIRRRFPHADLTIENRAIGGFASQLLRLPAEHDCYPFYPDLVIFHVYGGDKEYEEIIRNIRSRTTAEVLMQKDHVTQWPAENPDPNKDKSLWWDDRMNREMLPRIAQKYGCGLVDIRSGWLTYLKAQKLEPKALLRDEVHLNEHGCYVLAQIILRYLTYRPELKAEATVREERPRFKNGTLTLDFIGNRVDIVGLVGGDPRVLIDGRPPSVLALHRITRPQPSPWNPCALVRVDHEAPLVAENWTLEITGQSGDKKTFTYVVKGSVTGEDGTGSSERLFVSRSGRVKISPEFFFRSFRTDSEIPKGYQITWSVLPLFLDRVVAGKKTQVQTVAQGLTNGPHTLTLLAEEPERPPRLAAIRLYCPPVPESQ